MSSTVIHQVFISCVQIQLDFIFYTGTCLLTKIASPSVPQTRYWPRTSKLLTDSVWLGSMWVVSRRPLLESPLSQALIRDWFPPTEAMALWEIMLLFLLPEKKTALHCIAFCEPWHFGFIYYLNTGDNKQVKQLMHEEINVVLYKAKHVLTNFHFATSLRWKDTKWSCLAKRRARLNVKSPSAAVNRPRSMWTGDLDLLGGSGLPTLCVEEKKSLNISLNEIDSFFKCTEKFNMCIILSAEWASVSEKGVLPCRTSQTHNMPSCPPVATMCCWLGCLSTQCRGTRSPNLKKKVIIIKKNKQAIIRIFFWLQTISWKQFRYNRSSYKEKICDGELLGCLKSHSFNCPIEFTVKISVVRR